MFILGVVAIHSVVLELRSTVDRDTRTSDPAGYVRNIFRFTDSLQWLHPKRDLTPGLRLRKIRHVGVDHAWRDCGLEFSSPP